MKTSSKRLLSSPKPPKKKLINKPKKFEIELSEEEQTSDLFKNSPKSLKRSTKSVVRLKTPKSAKLEKKLQATTPRGKAFFFPPETPKSKAKKIAKSPSPRPLKNSTNLKQKTPKQKSKKNIRPKTASSNRVLKAETGSFPCINDVVTQVQPPVSNEKEDIYSEHLFQTFQALKIVKSLPPVDLEQLKLKRLEVPVRPGYEGKKTVVFDLDETLVHCCENPDEMVPDVFLPVTFPNGEVINAGLNIRPFARECLKEMSKYFEIFIFTASHQCYANVVLDYLDPKKEMIHQRFFRDNCINMNGIYIKDLRIFANRKLSDMVIIDNAAYSFAYQLDNGIPIISWHDDREDREMINLMDYLKSLIEVDDIREVNVETFHLRTFYEDYMNEFIMNNEMSNN